MAKKLLLIIAGIALLRDGAVVPEPFLDITDRVITRFNTTQ